jgi:hypothetical protein
MKPFPVRPFANPGKTDGLVPPVTSRFVGGVRLRANLPVVSNRAFIRAWAASRANAGAPAIATKPLAR